MPNSFYLYSCRFLKPSLPKQDKLWRCRVANIVKLEKENVNTSASTAVVRSAGLVELSLKKRLYPSTSAPPLKLGASGEGEGGGGHIGERDILRRGGSLRISGTISTHGESFSVSVDGANPEVVSHVGVKAGGGPRELVSGERGNNVVAGRVSRHVTLVEVVASDVDTTGIFGGRPKHSQRVVGDSVDVEADNGVRRSGVGLGHDGTSEGTSSVIVVGSNPKPVISVLIQEVESESGGGFPVGAGSLVITGEVDVEAGGLVRVSSGEHVESVDLSGRFVAFFGSKPGHGGGRGFGGIDSKVGGSIREMLSISGLGGVNTHSGDNRA